LKDVIKRITKINLIDSYIVRELSKNSAKIKIKYFGKIKICKMNLSITDLSLEFYTMNGIYL
jgi:hypothetical protein